MSAIDTVFVVACDYRSYAAWCERKGHAPTGQDHRYVSGVQVLAGLRQPVKILFIHGWQARKDWRQIYNRALVIGRRPS